MADREGRPPEPPKGAAANEQDTPPSEDSAAKTAGAQFNLEGRVLQESTPGLACELCGGPVLDRHCKVVCLNCGFHRDCSDP